MAIVGCGLIGRKRAAALGGARLVACADLDRDARRGAGADRAGRRRRTDDWRAAVARADVDIVVVATTNDALAEIARAALEAGKHVLVEKPAARNVAELEPLIAAAARRAACACASASTTATTRRCRRRASSSTAARSAR